MKTGAAYLVDKARIVAYKTYFKSVNTWKGEALSLLAFVLELTLPFTPSSKVLYLIQKCSASPLILSMIMIMIQILPIIIKIKILLLLPPIWTEPGIVAGFAIKFSIDVSEF